MKFIGMFLLFVALFVVGYIITQRNKSTEIRSQAANQKCVLISSQATCASANCNAYNASWSDGKWTQARPTQCVAETGGCCGFWNVDRMTCCIKAGEYGYQPQCNAQSVTNCAGNTHCQAQAVLKEKCAGSGSGSGSGGTSTGKSNVQCLTANTSVCAEHGPGYELKDPVQTGSHKTCTAGSTVIICDTGKCCFW